MNKHPITTSKNNLAIYVNLVSSPAALNLNRQPHLLNLIKEVLAPMTLTGESLSLEYDMGRNVGNTDIVETTDKDTIFYARPHKQESYSRYVKSHAMTLSPYLTVLLEQDSDGDYELKNAWIGRLAPPFPGNPKENTKSKAYWDSHAWLADSQVVQTKTITKVCPY